jgi:hypothetical protein
MLYSWKIKAYAVLVKAEKWDLQPVEGSLKPVVEEKYRNAVSEYLATGL